MKAPTSNIQHPSYMSYVQQLSGLRFEGWSFSGAFRKGLR